MIDESLRQGKKTIKISLSLQGIAEEKREIRPSIAFDNIKTQSESQKSDSRETRTRTNSVVSSPSFMPKPEAKTPAITPRTPRDSETEKKLILLKNCLSENIPDEGNLDEKYGKRSSSISMSSSCEDFTEHLRNNIAIEIEEEKRNFNTNAPENTQSHSLNESEKLSTIPEEEDREKEKEIQPLPSTETGRRIHIMAKRSSSSSNIKRKDIRRIIHKISLSPKDPKITHLTKEISSRERGASESTSRTNFGTLSLEPVRKSKSVLESNEQLCNKNQTDSLEKSIKFLTGLGNSLKEFLTSHKKSEKKSEILLTDEQDSFEKEGELSNYFEKNFGDNSLGLIDATIDMILADYTSAIEHLKRNRIAEYIQTVASISTVIFGSIYHLYREKNKGQGQSDEAVDSYFLGGASYMYSEFMNRLRSIKRQKNTDFYYNLDREIEYNNAILNFIEHKTLDTLESAESLVKQAIPVTQSTAETLTKFTVITYPLLGMFPQREVYQNQEIEKDVKLIIENKIKYSVMAGIVKQEVIDQAQEYAIKSLKKIEERLNSENHCFSWIMRLFYKSAEEKVNHINNTIKAIEDDTANTVTKIIEKINETLDEEKILENRSRFFGLKVNFFKNPAKTKIELDVIKEKINDYVEKEGTQIDSQHLREMSKKYCKFRTGTSPKDSPRDPEKDHAETSETGDGSSLLCPSPH